MENLEEDIRSLKNSISELEQQVSRLLKILKGREDADEPEGLVHSVYMNSQFRKVLIAWLWLLTGSVLTIGAQVFFNILTYGGN